MDRDGGFGRKGGGYLFPGVFGGNAITVQPGRNIKLETTGTSGAGINLVVPGPVPQPIGITTSGAGTLELKGNAGTHTITPGPLTSGTGGVTIQTTGQVNLNGVALSSPTGTVQITGGNTGLASVGVLMQNAGSIAGNQFDPVYASHGEDRDFFRRVIATGGRFVWCAEASVPEIQPAERATRAVFESLPRVPDMFQNWENWELQRRRYERDGQFPAEANS